MHDELTRDRFIALRAQNWTFDHIARELNGSQPTLIVWSRQFQYDIQNLQAIHKEALPSNLCLLVLISGSSSVLGKSCRLNNGKIPVKKWYDFGKVLSLNFTTPKFLISAATRCSQTHFPSKSPKSRKKFSKAVKFWFSHSSTNRSSKSSSVVPLCRPSSGSPVWRRSIIPQPVAAVGPSQPACSTVFRPLNS